MFYEPTAEQRKAYENLSICILTPCGGYEAPVRFLRSVVNMVAYSWMHGLKIYQMGNTERTVVDWARNDLARIARGRVNEYTGEKFTHLLWLDDDHVFNPDMALWLAQNAHLDMVSALYYGRCDQILPVAYVKDTVEEYKHYPIIDVPEALCEVDAVGFGSLFAHREVFMSGPFTAVFLAKYLNDIGFYNTYPIISLLLITLFSALVSATVAIMLERIAYRPLRYAPRLVPLITAIGASFFLQYTFRGMYGNDPETYPTLNILRGVIHIGPIYVPKSDALVIVSSMVLMLILYSVVQYTKVGKAMRSVSEDKETAALMGINVDRVIVFTFTLGGISAGIAGILYALIFSQVHFYMGFIPGLKAFTAAVLGGIGNVVGAWLGGTLLG